MTKAEANAEIARKLDEISVKSGEIEALAEKFKLEVTFNGPNGMNGTYIPLWWELSN